MAYCVLKAGRGYKAEIFFSPLNLIQMFIV